jgi:hypothetical protein
MDFAGVARGFRRQVTLVDLHARMQGVIAEAESMPGGGLIQIRTRTERRRTGSVTAVEIEVADTGRGTTLRLSLPAAVDTQDH